MQLRRQQCPLCEKLLARTLLKNLWESVMSKVEDFPREKQAPSKAQVAPSQAAKTPDTPLLIKGIWVVTVLIWPILKWVVSIDCVFKLIRAIYYWDTPGVHAGWTFMLHFGVLSALTYFVSVYQPKGL